MHRFVWKDNEHEPHLKSNRPTPFLKACHARKHSSFSKGCRGSSGFERRLYAQNDMLKSLQGSIRNSKSIIDDQKARLDSLQRTINELQSDPKAKEAHNQIMQWELYRNDGEDLPSAKKRFFRSMSPATGGARLFQQGCAQLLTEFDELCNKHDIPYWIAFGTLLGAVRHGGFIPWDDDIDLCMMRSDIQHIVNMMQNDNKYRVSIIYDAWNFCKQVRFMYRDRRNPCFLDLFIFEETNAPPHTPDTFDRLFTLRHRMIDEMRSSDLFPTWKSKEFVPVEDPLSRDIERLFAQYREESASILMTPHPNASETEGVIWALRILTISIIIAGAARNQTCFPHNACRLKGMRAAHPQTSISSSRRYTGTSTRCPMTS